MDQRQWNLTVIPRRDVGAGLELTRLREPFGDPLQVVFEPVRHEQRLAVGRLDQVFEGVEFALMNYRGVASLVVDRARGQLQQLAQERGGVRGVDDLLIEVEHHLVTQLLIDPSLSWFKVDDLRGDHELGQGQIIGGAYRQGDVTDRLVDLVLSTRCGLVGEDLLPVALIGDEPAVAVVGDEPSEAMSFIQQTELRPQVHQPISCRRSG